MIWHWDSIAHEIGHILVGEGHPDESGGPAPLYGTLGRKRLMGSGELGVRGKLLVKAEWDEAEVWLNQNIPDEED